MPTQLVVQDNHANDIRVKTVYSGEVMITYINHSITLEQFTQEMVAICRFAPDQVFTMKWVDEEGDPCTISTQLELDEALRLYELNRDSELTVHGPLKASPIDFLLQDHNFSEKCGIHFDNNSSLIEN
ncbi:unnamed protein product [Leptidea sinapis]|uniref:PB1 domain-containing protein n=1 Tax=Leptidea sinapis TaxID=189913 RepID=A0A5E4QJM3_9NEOP|nr:unnamed protein product [Leptidea sinapis]